MPKILPNDAVTYEPGREPGGGEQHPGLPAPATAVEHPADGTDSPPVENAPGDGQPPGDQVTEAGPPASDPAPAAGPRVPPRRPASS